MHAPFDKLFFRGRCHTEKDKEAKLIMFQAVNLLFFISNTKKKFP